MPEFSKLSWLKRTDGHKFTGAELRVLLSIFNHSGSDGRKSHPGIKRMMAETGYGKAAVSSAVSSLKTRGWISEVYKGSGVSGSASVFDLVPDAPNPPSSSPVDEQPTDGSSSPGDEQLAGSSSPTADGCSPGVDRVVRLEWTPSDPLSDPEGSDPLGGPFDRPSDPREVRYPPNHLDGSPETLSGLGVIAGRDKTAELSNGRPDSEGLPVGQYETDEPNDRARPDGLAGLDTLCPSVDEPRGWVCPGAGSCTDPFCDHIPAA